MKLWLAQCAPQVGDMQGNSRIIVEQMQQAAQHGCTIAVFPELMLCGYPPEDLLLRPAFMATCEQAMETIRQATTSADISQVCAIIGAPHANEQQLFNSVFAIRNGIILNIYNKQILPNYGVFDERRYFTAGNGEHNVVEIDGQRIGIGICEDLWDDALAESLPENCDAWVYINASPFHVDKQREREALTQKRAQMLGAPVIYVNSVGGQDELVFDGGSHVCHANGIIDRAALFQEQGLCIDSNNQPQSNMPPLPDPVAQMCAALVRGVRDYVTRNHCSQVVIGLSGGIDSAVTAAIAVKALGCGNVLGVLLPSRYSSQHSLDDALELAKLLNIETTTLPIQTSVEAIEATLAPSFQTWRKTSTDVTEENIQARIRGVLLMAVSNKTGRMLLTTGNKSEMAVGYATLYGDMAGGFAVLKDLYKTQVFALAHYFNRDTPMIPQHSIDKPPSAELRPDQKDSDSLPDYPELDAILQASIEQRLSMDEIIAQGHDAADVRHIIHLLYATEYKRRQSAPGVKITQQAFGKDRRYPMTHRFIS